MHHFEDLDQVQGALQRLMQREPPLAAVLPRQPGTKEARYAHLMSGDIDYTVQEQAVSGSPTLAGSPPDTDLRERIAHLEQVVVELRSRIEELTRELAEFRRQFQ